MFPFPAPPPHPATLSYAFLLSPQLDMLDSFLGDVILSRKIFQDVCSAGFNSQMYMKLILLEVHVEYTFNT